MDMGAIYTYMHAWGHAWPLQLVRRQRLITSDITSHHDPTGHCTENRPDQWLDLIIQTCVLLYALRKTIIWLVKRTRHATCHPEENPDHAFSSVWLSVCTHKYNRFWKTDEPKCMQPTSWERDHRNHMHCTFLSVPRTFWCNCEALFSSKFFLQNVIESPNEEKNGRLTESRRLHARPRPPFVVACRCRAQLDR
jgi:hypothetical protein